MTSHTAPDRLPYPDDPNAPADAPAAFAALANATQTALTQRSAAVDALTSVVAGVGKTVVDGFAVRPDTPTIRSMFQSVAVNVAGHTAPFAFDSWEYVGSPAVVAAAVYLVHVSANRPADGATSSDGFTSHSRVWRVDLTARSGVGTIQPALYQYKDGRCLVGWRVVFGSTTVSAAHSVRSVHLGKCFAVSDIDLVAHSVGL
jgi:hypothetical protein